MTKLTYRWLLGVSLLAACSRPPALPESSPPIPTARPEVVPTASPAVQADATAPTAGNPPSAAASVDPATPAYTGPLGAADHDFALRLYATQRSVTGNVFVSPASARVALAMAYAGARGETATQMARALGFAPDVASTGGYFGPLLKNWNQASDPKVELRVVNQLWGRKGARFLPEFLDSLRGQFAAPLEQVDFRGAPNPSRLKINAWVEGKTAHLIRDLLQPSDVDASTALVLTNAIYFKGKWTFPFPMRSTAPDTFHVASGKDTQASFMHLRGRFSYGSTADAALLALPYGAGAYSMLIVLPVSDFGIDDLEKILGPQWLDAAIAGMREREVLVTLPKFSTTKRTSMREALSAMGMVAAFQETAADLSGMNGEAHSLFLSDVIQKAFVKVDESGTEAAAATGAVATYTSAVERPVFRADHPFVFFIRDGTGNLLFAGRLRDPT